jgi:4-methylaminobutanoate oxidase (formaldehyde-forming)
LAWLRRKLPGDANAVVTDVTSGYAVLSVMGPNARRLLSEVTSADLSNEAFPFGTGKEIEIGYASALALRVTYVGELGWELYIPTEFAQDIFDRLIAAGTGHDPKLAGMHALNSLRLEKAFRHWGHDITDEDNPVAAGLGFAVAWNKTGGFMGREALLKIKEAGIPKKRLVQFAMLDPEPLLYHNEPIWCNQKIVGDVTSGMYGHSIGACLGMGYVENEGGVTREFVESGSFEIEVAGARFPARASLRGFYDPSSERPRR